MARIGGLVKELGGEENVCDNMDKSKAVHARTTDNTPPLQTAAFQICWLEMHFSHSANVSLINSLPGQRHVGDHFSVQRKMAFLPQIFGYLSVFYANVSYQGCGCTLLRLHPPAPPASGGTVGNIPTEGTVVYGIIYIIYHLCRESRE